MGSSAPPAQVTLEPGTRLDRYELLCVLAHGGMANVWLARVQGKLGFQKLFAVKTILPNVADDAAFKTMFLDEARIASRIEHPNVVHMIDVGEAAKVAYLVMDLVEGEPLHKLPRACEKLGQRIPLGVVLRILADACHGLHAAHELRDDAGQLLNVVHRDMSPSNILVAASGVSKVIDFGVAKARDRSTGQTTVGTLKGKISYMPREQALGQDVDRRADTWALGAVLYYLLAGRPPYKEEQQLATLQLAMNGAPIPPLPVTLPVSLRTAVTRALAHEPSQRYQTAAEMGEALEQLMRKLGVVTTHTQVGQFVQQVLGEKLESRKQLVASALAEAANRERARSALTAASNGNDGADESGSHNQALIAVPTAVISVPRLDGSEPITGSGPLQVGFGALNEHKTDASTGAAFVTGTMSVASRPTKRLLPAIVAGTGFLAIVGIALIAFSVRAGRQASTKAADALPDGANSAAVAGGDGESTRSAGGAFDAPSEGAAAGGGIASSPIAVRTGDAASAASAASASAKANVRPTGAVAGGAGGWQPPQGQAKGPAATPPTGTGATTPITTATGKAKGREDYGF